MFYKKLFFGFLLFLFTLSCTTGESEKTALEQIRMDTEWLSSEDRAGRLAGTIHEAETAGYIMNRFSELGLLPAGDQLTYLQQFVLDGPIPQALNVDRHLARNVIAMIEGTEKSGQFIILAAHYDGQGSGGVISMDKSSEPQIHHSADDNASGTAGILHLAKQFSEDLPKSTLLFVAFSGEELGLLGSRHFIDKMEINSDSILAMINFDMIGRLEDGNLTLFGTGTSTVWDDLIDKTPHDSLTINKKPSGSGASDHLPFYEAGIPVLHYFTGTHPDYHSSSDTAEKLKDTGMLHVLEQAKSLIRELDHLDAAEVDFLETTDPRSVTMKKDGLTLGITPDYSWPRKGLRIEKVGKGTPAADSGMKPGDVIVEMDGHVVFDIYDYMENLNTFNIGDSLRLTVERNGQQLSIDVQF